MVNEKCTHCGKRLAYGEFRFPDVHVLVKSACFLYQYDAACLCEDCFKKLNDRIGRMVREV